MEKHDKIWKNLNPMVKKRLIQTGIALGVLGAEGASYVGAISPPVATALGTSGLATIVAIDYAKRKKSKRDGKKLRKVV
jgi:hypothetical protein